MLTRLLLSAALLVLVAFDIRRYARNRTPELERKLDGVLSLFAYFFWLCAVVMGIAAGYRGITDSTIRRTWTAVDTEVVRCRSRHHTINLHQQEYWGADCVFRDDTRQPARDIPLELCCSRDEHTTDRWLDQHPSGSRFRLYLEPGGGKEISFGGPEDPFHTHPDMQSLTFALVTTVFWFTARWITRQRAVVS